MNKQIIDNINAIPIWKGDIEIKKLVGGITNENFIVIDDKNKYVVRLGNDISEHLISRSNELIASIAAAKCGISPNVIFHDKGILVLDFIDSKTLTDIDVRKNIINIIPIVKKIHREVPKNIYGQSVIFWVFHVINNYAKFLNDNNSHHTKILDLLLKKSNQIEQIASPFEIVFGHNDLLSANFLDDGSRIWIIDWGICRI